LPPLSRCSLPSGTQAGGQLPPGAEGHEPERLLRSILAEDRLQARFQPIVDLRTGHIHAFEGLIRGPSDSLLHAPEGLFKVAGQTGQLFALEAACCRTLLRAYARSGFTQKLFLNLSPDSITTAGAGDLIPLALLEELGIAPGGIVIELTEALPIHDLGVLVRTAEQFRQAGFAIALDDLGEGFSSLRLWSELRPEYVKVDKHFILGVSQDPIKHQFLKSLCDIAVKTGALIVAEGIELEADLAVVLELGLDLGQGYLFGRPAPEPHAVSIPVQLKPSAGRKASGWLQDSRTTASRLMVELAPLHPDTPNGVVERRFNEDGELQSIPVVKDGIPVGLINRHVFLDFMFKPFSREVFGKKPVAALMDRNILVVDHRTSLHELSRLIVESDPRHILHGFILTREGFYAGMGSGHDLMREITQMQIKAARYANPLTGLPGNVPINEHLDDLLAQDVPFVACYCDLDHFKPYNDVYGYQRGDEVIGWTGELLRAHADPDLDFVGHIGGDDFMLVLQSSDWEARCRTLLEAFDLGRRRFFSREHNEKGRYPGEDRKRKKVMHPLVSLSLGAVKCPPGLFQSYHEISAAAAVAKKEAKRLEGSSLFVERRTQPV